MKKYCVEIKETSYGFVTVEADSAEQAKEFAEDIANMGEAYWDHSEFTAGNAWEEE